MFVLHCYVSDKHTLCFVFECYFSDKRILFLYFIATLVIQHDVFVFDSDRRTAYAHAPFLRFTVYLVLSARYFFL